jgi:transcription elongation factor Elf1
MKHTQKNLVHCAIVRLQNKEMDINLVSIKIEYSRMFDEYMAGNYELLEELNGMEPSEIQAERKMFKKYFAMFGIK